MGLLFCLHTFQLFLMLWKPNKWNWKRTLQINTECICIERGTIKKVDWQLVTCALFPTMLNASFVLLPPFGWLKTFRTRCVPNILSPSFTCTSIIWPWIKMHRCLDAFFLLHQFIMNQVEIVINHKNTPCSSDKSWAHRCWVLCE